MSAINFGYALTAVSVVNISQLITNYDISLSKSTTQSLLIGMMPIGGIFGAGVTKVVLKYVNRKQGIYFLFVLLWIGLGMILVRNMYTIILGRFVEGIAIGLYVSISPILLQEVTPKELRPRVMTMFGLSKSFGCMLANVLQNIFLAVGWDNASILLLIFNGFLSAVQVVLYFFFIPDSPLEMMEKGEHEKLETALLTIYKEEYFEDVYN